MPPHPLSSVSVSLADDYASDDDREYVVNTPPPPSPSCPSTPIDADMTDDVSVNEDLRPVTPADGQRAFKLAPISSASHKDITLPPLQDLIADVCRDCELERSRRASWDTCHSRVHPRHLYAGGDGMVLHAQRPPVHPEVAVATPRDPRRHTVHGPLVPPQYIFYPSPPPAASRPRYASHIPTWTCSSHTSQHSDPRADQRSAYGAAHEHSRLHPDFEFADYSLSSQSRNIAHLHPEAAVDPRDATFTPRHQDARRQSLPQTWRRTHVDSRVSRSGHYTTLRRTSDDEATPSSPDLPLTRTPSPSPFQQPFPRRQSLSRPYPSPHAPTTETSTRRSSSAQPARRHVIAKGRPQPLAQQPFSESSASPHSTAGSRKRGGSVTSDVGTVASASSDEPTTPFDSNATRPPSKQHPFNDLQVTELSDKYLLQLHPRPKKILCQWKGGCSRWIHAPLTASVVAHLQTYHGVGVRERGDDGIQCCWGGKCGRMLKACSMRNHILNSHEKIKTGDCKLCGSAISRAETYLMHRHLTSCLNKIAREGDLDARLRGAGVVIIRDPETGEISFSPAPGAPPPRTLAERKDAYDDDMDDLPPSPTPVPHERPLG